jgi:hypothetical protein
MNHVDRRAVVPAEMKLLRYVAGYDRKGQIRNENIRQKLNIFYLHERIQQNKKSCCEHILHVDP